jgi:membrane protease YdiL (CAAX protease family)
MEFWTYMLASSIVLPPLFEEFFFRGYAQTRFTTAWSSWGAILTVAALFVLAHLQYFDGSFVGTALIPLGVWQFIVLGYAQLYTGSLVAPIVAHAILNIPMRAQEQLPFAVGLALIVV